MNEPRRWLDDLAALSPDERRVLEAGLGAAAPTGAKTALFGAIVAGLPNGAGAGPGGSLGAGSAATSTGGAAVGAGSALGLVKSAVVGFALGAGTVAGWGALGPWASPSQPAPIAATSVGRPSAARSVGVPSRAEAAPRAGDLALGGAASTARSARPSEVRPSSESDVRDAPDVGSVRAFPETAPRDDAGTSATSESKRLAEARSLLREGRARAALVALDRLRTDFPRGVLVQEREALAIEALLALGERPAARQRATDFLVRYPASPHARAARRALE